MEDNRFSQTKKVGILGIIGNLFLLIIKATIGFTTKSQAMIADSINSAGDIFASLMTFIGNKISSVPKDDDHNFGHGKAEYIFSLFISLSMILVSAKLIYDSVVSLFNPRSVEYPFWLVLVCITTIVTKAILFIYTSIIEKKTKSILIESLKKDHRNDTIVTSCTLLSVILNLFGIYWVDGIVGIGIAIVIAISGIKIFIESYNILMDKSIDEKTKNEIIEITKKYKNIQKTTHLTSTPVGYKYLVSISIFVDGNMNTFESHHIADALERELNSLDNVYLSIIHVNPI